MCESVSDFLVKEKLIFNKSVGNTMETAHIFIFKQSLLYFNVLKELQRSLPSTKREKVRHINWRIERQIGGKREIEIQKEKVEEGFLNENDHVLTGLRRFDLKLS